MRTITHSIASTQDAKAAADKQAQLDYAAELEAYLDSREYKQTNIDMRTNRAVGF